MSGVWYCMNIIIFIRCCTEILPKLSYNCLDNIRQYGDMIITIKLSGVKELQSIMLECGIYVLGHYSWTQTPIGIFWSMERMLTVIVANWPSWIVNVLACWTMACFLAILCIVMLHEGVALLVRFTTGHSGPPQYLMFNFIGDILDLAWEMGWIHH